MPANRHIFLIGFMGSGKSYLGRQLARAMDYPFIDLDEYLESKLGASILDFFERAGEASFRREESQALREMASQPPSIIACGGGTPCQDDNMEWMSARGTTVFLDVHQDILLERLERESAHRPLIAAQKDLAAYLANKLAQRRPIYEQAAVTLFVEDEQMDYVSLLKALLCNDGDY
jgi:shikimate kinase